MAYTQEQINSLQKIQTQLKTPEAFQNYVTQNYGADKLNEIKSNLQQNIQQPTQTLTQDQLKQKIATGNFSASEARQYNQMTGNNQGARDVALTSKEGVQNLQTTVTPEEAAKIAQAGITDVGTGVKPDMTAGTKEEFKQEITKSEKQTPTTTTDITYQEDKTPYDANKVISKAPQFTGADGKIYQTVRNSDNTLTTIDVTTGQPVTGKYTDAERDSIKQGFLKSPEQIQQETQQNIQLDPNNLFNQIRSGQVPTKDIQNTDEYKKSKQRADNLARFENMSAKDLSYAINNGDLLPGTQTYNDLKTINPSLVAEAEKLNSLNSALTTTEKSNTDVLTKITEQIFKIFNGDTTTLKTKLSENPEVVKLNTDMATKKNELNSLKDSINNAYRDIEKELSGTGATKGYVQALASRRTEDLTRDYNTKLNEYNTMAGQLKTITEMVGDELEQEEKLQAKQLQALQFAYGIAKDETDYQRSLQAEQRQREYQQAQDIQNFEQQKEMLALQQEYEDRNIQTDMIQVGNKNVLINRKTGETIKSFDLPAEKVTQTQDWAKLNDGTLYNQRTGETKVIQGTSSTPTSVNVTPSGNYANITYTMSSGTKKPIKVDSVAKDDLMNALNSIGKGLIIGDSFRDSARQEALYKELSAKGATVAKPGTSKHEKGLAVDIYSGKNAKGQLLAPTKEQVAIMNANGWFQTAGEDDKGHFEYLGKQIQTTQKQYNDNDIALLGSVTKLDKQGREILKENGFTEQDWAKFNAGLLPPTQSQKIQTQEVLDLLTKLETSPGLNNAVGYKGPIGSFTTIAGTDKADFEALYNTFRDTLAFANLDKMKGAMSDKDIEFLRNTAGAINLDMSEKTFKKNLLDIKKKYTNLLNKGQISSNNKTQTNTQQSNNASNYLKSLGY